MLTETMLLTFSYLSLCYSIRKRLFIFLQIWLSCRA